jgi:exopolysaccharide biosynthesis polyprenyl glycosylphosphotransferase
LLREHNRLIRKIQLFLDIGITILSFFIAVLFRRYAEVYLVPIGPLTHYLFLLYIIVPLWVVLLYFNGAYQSIRVRTLFQTLWPVIKTVFTGAIILMTILFAFKFHTISRALILIFLTLNLFLLLGERFLTYLFLHSIRKRGYNTRSVLIVGTGERARDFAGSVRSHREWGSKIIGFVDTEPSMLGKEICEARVIGMMEDIPEILSKNQVDEVFFIVPRKWLDSIEDAVFACEEIGVSVRIACDFFQKNLYVRTHLDILDDWPLLSFSSTPHFGEIFVAKRVFDFIFSFIVLLILAPALFIIALAIKLTSPGPVFFRQMRGGLNGRSFELLKFRTMVDGAESKKADLEGLNEMTGPVFKIKEDPRITPLGGFLRKFSLDEFPQFINVLKGDMSVVGPRPHPVHEVEQYGFSQRRRLSVRPGLTCLWQVNGRNKIVDFKDLVRLDLEYIDQWSFLLDIKIILRTIPAVLKGTGL